MDQWALSDAEASFGADIGAGRSLCQVCPAARLPKQTKERNTHDSSSGRRPKTSASSTRQFVQRAVSHLLTRLQNSRYEPDELHVRKHAARVACSA